jgi:hypothetical protein
MTRQAVKGLRSLPDKNERSVVTVGSAVSLLRRKTHNPRGALSRSGLEKLEQPAPGSVANREQLMLFTSPRGQGQSIHSSRAYRDRRRAALG